MNTNASEKLKAIAEENDLKHIMVSMNSVSELRDLLQADDDTGDAQLLKMAVSRIKSFDHKTELLKGQLDLWLKG